MLAIKTENLCKKYKKLVAVDKLNLEVKRGEIFSLLGTNGAGKTTTIKMLTTLINATSGEGYILEKSIKNDAAEVKKLIAVSPQESATADNLTVRENLELICKLYGFSKKETKEKLEKIAIKLELDEVLDKKANKLSGGFRRRLSIALALIVEPKILFLDEPTLALDVISRYEIWDIIKSLSGETTVILTTHYMEEAEALSDRIGIMKDGRLLLVDTAESIKATTKEETFERAFIKIVREAER